MDATQKKILSRTILALLLLVAAIFLYRHFFIATITVRSTDKNGLTSINQIINNNVSDKTITRGDAKLTASVHSGSYIVSAYSNTYETNRTVTIKRGQHITITLSPTLPQSIESVTGEAATSVTADKSSLSFIDTDTGQLINIDSDNNVAAIGGVTSFTDAKWASASLGIAHNAANELYLITDNQVTKLGFTNSSSDSVDYDITKDGTIYISQNGVLYKGTATGNFEKIYTSKAKSTLIAATPNRILVMQRNETDEGIQSTAKGASLIMLDATGKKIAEQKNINGYRAAWSADEKHVLIKSDSGSLVYNDKLGQKKAVPAQRIGDVAWVTNSSFTYSNNDTVWQYNLSSGHAQQLSTSAGGTVSNLFSDGDYVYLSADNSNSLASNYLGRVGVHQQLAPSYTSGLSIFLPTQAGDCKMSYANFTHFSALLYYPPGVNANTCVGYARDILNYNQVPNNDATYQTLPQIIRDGR